MSLTNSLPFDKPVSHQQQRNWQEQDRWLLSFYHGSELNGALFFGRMARVLPHGEIKRDMTHHFADESNHASWWLDCLDEIGVKPMRMKTSYQDAYLDAVGVPSNLMEILAITHVFEARVIGHYDRHRRSPNLHPSIAATFDRIMDDERWHLQWVSAAIGNMAPQYGKEHIDSTLRRYREADREIYAKAISEFDQRVQERTQA